MNDLKEIHIGKYIEMRIKELNIPMQRICNFMKKDKMEIVQMFECSSLDSDILLRWSKILEYDFFRIYCQHLILYCPPSSANYINQGVKKKKSDLPEFRKNIYTKELINYILELIRTNKKTKIQVINEYNVPKTTLYKWISKYKIKE